LARILLLLILGFAIYLLFRGFTRSQLGRDEPPQSVGAGGEDMVACARCGVNVPRSEMKEVDGRLVCAANPNCR